MDKSEFAEKFTRKSGILELMDDLGQAMSGGEDYLMLGGGNPAHIPEINNLWRQRMAEILNDGRSFENMLANYNTPQGKMSFLEAVANFFNREYGWNIGPQNIGITNGSQSLFFMLFNMLGGKRKNGKVKKILFPLMPEYIGYADQAAGDGIFVGEKPLIEEFADNTFKYRIDFGALELSGDLAAVCCSRPTNPTGNVLTDSEIAELSQMTAKAGLPLIIDNAYGAPFPNILFEDAAPAWDEHIVYTMSLSKLGLPSTRTGIVIACQELIKDLSAVNAILSLANGSVGQVLTQPLFESGKILEISKKIIRPFYLEKSRKTQELIHNEIDGAFPYALHKSEGALFLWLWFKDLPIPAKKLYKILKEKRVLAVPGEYFFYGLKEEWKHTSQCLRLTYSQDGKIVEQGIKILVSEVKKLY